MKNTNASNGTRPTINSALIRRAYERYAHGDLEAILDLVDPDLAWTYLDASQPDPEPQVCHGRHELEHALGEASRHRVASSWDQLSPQELQIAHMAAVGLSNREIGQRLFLSHRTVASHLYAVFPQLGVTVRGQLHAATHSSTARFGLTTR